MNKRSLILNFPALILAISLLSPQISTGQVSQARINIKLKTSPGIQLQISGVKVRHEADTGNFHVFVDQKTKFPLSITAKGPLGGSFQTSVASVAELKTLVIPEGIISNPHPDPKTLPHLPKLCPRLEKLRTNEKAASPQEKVSFVYQGKQDQLNHTPSFQIFDPDATSGKQPLIAKLLDGKNVLTVAAIRLRHDYEDAKTIKYRKKDPQSGKTIIFREGNGGFYANLQYAVIPYSEELLTKDTQTLLHLAQGSLSKIGKQALRPSIRTHSFLPGPFLSQKKFHYQMCEWGDTAHQAKNQQLNYQDLIIWDWDFPVTPNDRILLIVWEGDEEENYPDKKQLPQHYLIDDFVGIFDITREQTKKPLTLHNGRKDFEITLMTQDISLKK